MISIFKRNLFFNSLLLLLYVIIVRVHSLIAPGLYIPSESDTFIVQGFYSVVSSPIWQSIVAIILVYIQAIYINRVVIKHRLAPDTTLLPGLIYVLLVFLGDGEILSPHLIANGFIIAAISQLFKIYKKPKVADVIFNTGFLIGLASLFVPNYIYLIFTGTIGLFVLRAVKRNQLVQLFSGLGIVYFLAGGGMYLYDKSILEEFSKLSFSPSLTFTSLEGTEFYYLFTWVALGILGVLNYGKYTLKKSIQAQKKVDILFWLLGGSVLLLFMTDRMQAHQVLLMFIPMSIFLNINFLNIRNPMIQEVIHIVLLVAGFGLAFGWFGI